MSKFFNSVPPQSVWRPWAVTQTNTVKDTSGSISRHIIKVRLCSLVNSICWKGWVEDSRRIRVKWITTRDESQCAGLDRYLSGLSQQIVSQMNVAFQQKFWWIATLIVYVIFQNCPDQMNESVSENIWVDQPGSAAPTICSGDLLAVCGWCRNCRVSLWRKILGFEESF